MTWSTLPLAVVTALYAVQAVVFAAQHKFDLATVIAGYVAANLGLLWSALK